MKISEAQIDNLVGLLDGYAEKGGHHLNVNVFTKDTASGRSGTSGEVSAAYGACVRIRGQLQQADKRAAG